MNTPKFRDVMDLGLEYLVIERVNGNSISFTTSFRETLMECARMIQADELPIELPTNDEELDAFVYTMAVVYHMQKYCLDLDEKHRDDAVKLVPLIAAISSKA